MSNDATVGREARVGNRVGNDEIQGVVGVVDEVQAGRKSSRCSHRARARTLPMDAVNHAPPADVELEPAAGDAAQAAVRRLIPSEGQRPAVHGYELVASGPRWTAAGQREGKREIPDPSG